MKESQFAFKDLRTTPIIDYALSRMRYRACALSNWAEHITQIICDSTRGVIRNTLTKFNVPKLSVI